MEEAVFQQRYPRGVLPVRGFRCQDCGEEVVSAEDAREAQRTAEALGLYEIQDRSVRRLQKHGSSTTVTLDPQLLREALRGAKAGDRVVVGRQGRRIVIESP